MVRGDYRYNGLGQRVEKSTGGVSTRYVYGVNGQLLSELNSAGTPQRDYVTLNGEPLAVITYTEQQGGLGTIIDNGEAGTSATGTWTTATDNKNTQWGSDYLMASGQTGSTYRWTPSMTAGNYNVYTWYVADNKAATQVPYTLVHNGVTDTVNIDQTTNGGQWVLLGTYTFSGDGTEYVEVSDANGQTNADALRFDPQGLPLQLVADIHYIHTDQLATPRAITDRSGTVVWRRESDPFGTTPANEDPDGDGSVFTYNPRFPGQYFDGETGLHYNYHRDYDPGTGRYVESDPSGLDGGLNIYIYVSGNPINWYDPTGLERIFEKDGVTFHAYPKPAGGSNYGEHARHGEGREYHVHINGDPNKRWNVYENKPLTEDDARKFTKKELKVCQSLSENEQKYLKRATRKVFHHNSASLPRLRWRYLSWFGPVFGALMSNSYEETCSNDYLNKLDEVCD